MIQYANLFPQNQYCSLHACEYKILITLPRPLDRFKISLWKLLQLLLCTSGFSKKQLPFLIILCLMYIQYFIIWIKMLINYFETKIGAIFNALVSLSPSWGLSQSVKRCCERPCQWPWWTENRMTENKCVWKALIILLSERKSEWWVEGKRERERD